MISPQTLYLTENRKTVVKEGDPLARFLLVRAGMELPDKVAEQYGVTAEGLVEQEDEDADKENGDENSDKPKAKARKASKKAAK